MIVGCGRKGKNLIIDLGKTQPDFNQNFTSDSSFKADLVFNYSEWRNPANHMRFVNDDEKAADEEFDAGYELHEASSISILSTADDERAISGQL